MTSSDLFDDESPAIEEEIAIVVADPSAWLNTPNVQFGGSRPADLLATPDGRQLLRDWIRSVKHGMIS